MSALIALLVLFAFFGLYGYVAERAEARRRLVHRRRRHLPSAATPEDRPRLRQDRRVDDLWLSIS